MFYTETISLVKWFQVSFSKTKASRTTTTAKTLSKPNSQNQNTLQLLEYRRN
jgi:hypothetical protein